MFLYLTRIFSTSISLAFEFLTSSSSKGFSFILVQSRTTLLPYLINTKPTSAISVSRIYLLESHFYPFWFTQMNTPFWAVLHLQRYHTHWPHIYMSSPSPLHNLDPLYSSLQNSFSFIFPCSLYFTHLKKKNLILLNILVTYSVLPLRQLKLFKYAHILTQTYSCFFLLLPSFQAFVFVFLQNSSSMFP